jgi:hypothetical protein
MSCKRLQDLKDRMVRWVEDEDEDEVAGFVLSPDDPGVAHA